MQGFVGVRQIKQLNYVDRNVFLEVVVGVFTALRQQIPTYAIQFRILKAKL